jgi:hypothetical protein
MTRDVLRYVLCDVLRYVLRDVLEIEFRDQVSFGLTINSVLITAVISRVAIQNALAGAGSTCPGKGGKRNLELHTFNLLLSLFRSKTGLSHFTAAPVTNPRA